ncbi:tetratricopeptide repeat protein [Hyphomonas sp.]|uniref:tetratricopeptide repeat protein n=1 Tax=Hyphomonas sp. TaxID=87 RepID=UPI00391DC6C4
MTDIFTEVDESVRQEKLQSVWKRWRPFVYGGVALLVGVVALNEFVLTPAAEARKAAQAAAFENAVKALEEGQYAEAEAAFRTIRETNPKLAPLATHFLARTLYEGGGDADGAAELLAVSGGTDSDPFGRLALLKAAYFRAGTMTLPELEAMLGGLLTDTSPAGALARELVAAKAFETGDYARARAEFNRLKFDAAASENLQRRADMALAAIPQGAGTAAPGAAEMPQESPEEVPASETEESVP